MSDELISLKSHIIKKHENVSQFVNRRFDLNDNLKFTFNISKTESSILNELENLRKKHANSMGLKFVKLSLSEQYEWQQYFNEQKHFIIESQYKFDKLENKVNQLIYENYGLNKEEIDIVEKSMK